MFDVITCGSATVDVFAKTKADYVTLNLGDVKRELVVYPTGAKIPIKHLEFQTGGGGTNTAVCFARLGLNTAYLGNIGNDANGDTIISELAKENITFIGTRGRQMTDYSIVLDSVGHDRTILNHKKASNHLNFKRIKKEHINAQWLYCSSLMGKSFDTFCELLKLAKKRKIKVAFNPSSYQAAWGLSKLGKVLKQLTLLVFNREEAAMLLGVSPQREVPELLRMLIKKGPKSVVITDGKNGAWCSDGKTIYFAPSDKKAKIVETTGAGDAFASTFVAGMIVTNSVSNALKMAATNAESVIAHYGAKNTLCTLKQLKQKMKKKPVRLKKY